MTVFKMKISQGVKGALFLFLLSICKSMRVAAGHATIKESKMVAIQMSVLSHIQELFCPVVALVPLHILSENHYKVQ